jgi:hypothetical protein
MEQQAMDTEQNRRFVAAHTQPPALSAQAQEDRDLIVVLRYDGMASGGDQKVFAMISAMDLAKLPADILDDLPLVSRDDAGVLRGSRDAFFMRTEAGTTLFVDSDVHADFINRMIDTSFENGFFVDNRRSDLRLMMNDNLDIDAPPRPAFIENSCAHVPAALALKEVRATRLEMSDEPSPFSH